MVLASCSRVGVDPFNAQQRVSLTPYPQSAIVYQKALDNPTDDVYQHNRRVLKLSGRLLADGMLGRAEQYLSSITPKDEALKDEKAVLQGHLYLLKGQTTKALKQLAKVSLENQSNNVDAIYYHEILKRIYQQRGDWLNALNESLSLERLYPAEMQQKNSREIWRTLSRIPLKNQMALALEASFALKGWLELNILFRQHQNDMNAMATELEKWKEVYPTHPGNRLISDNLLHTTGQTKVEKIALMLPLTGPLSGPGQAVRDGFMSAYYAKKGSRHPKIRFYDTNQKPIREIYQQALADGADFVIGPLSKDNVSQLTSTDTPVPTINLNDVAQYPGANMYQFGLSQSDEAKQVAIKAFDDAKRHALVIAPKGTWGESIASGFSSVFQGMGGVVSDTFYYSDNVNMSQEIKHLLHIDSSQQRGQSLSRLVGKKLKFTPTRRRDFDMIFLLAYPSKARQIRPLLRYYYAGDVPIYATSLVYSGSVNKRADRDLNGIIFAEMPWLLKSNVRLSKRAWPEQLNSYNRLYALGRDAFKLSEQLPRLTMFPLMGIRNNTGTLILDRVRRIHRRVDWAVFRRGRVSQRERSA